MHTYSYIDHQFASVYSIEWANIVIFSMLTIAYLHVLINSNHIR